MNTLLSYLLVVLAAIAPGVPESRRASIAKDVAETVTREERAFEGDDAGHRTALLMLAIAHFETGGSWAKWIDNGSCNDPSWRALNAELLVHGDCDAMRAWGLWQVHPPGGNRLVGRSYVRDRRKGLRAALYVARESLRRGIGLCAYSGERPPKCKKGNNRLKLAKELEERFPWQPATQPLAAD